MSETLKRQHAHGSQHTWCAVVRSLRALGAQTAEAGDTNPKCQRGSEQTPSLALRVGILSSEAEQLAAVVPPAGLPKSRPAKGTKAAARAEPNAAAVAKLVPVVKHRPPQLGLGTPVFDKIIGDALAERNIPGAALAIVRDGKLVVARGYGLANVKTKEPVALDTLFSTASVTKTITAAAVLRLADQGKLSLDDSAYALLGKPRPLGRAAIDPRMEKITAREILLQAAGWNSTYHPDALRQTKRIARLTAEKLPVSAEAVTRFGLSQPLDYVPGSEIHSSSFAYFLAKRIVERARGSPMKLTSASRSFSRWAFTTCASSSLHRPTWRTKARRYRNGTELPGGREAIAAPAGNWLATVVDLARFAKAVSGLYGKPLLSAKSHERDVCHAARTAENAKKRHTRRIGLGHGARTAAGREYHKSGSAAGVRAYIEHCGKDIDWVLLLNSDGTADGTTTAMSGLIQKVRQAIDGATEWPERDLF